MEPEEQLRRPAMIPKDDWDRLPLARQRRLSHVGRVEETNAGVAASQSCSSCDLRGSHCVVYTEVAHKRFQQRRSYTCSQYRLNSTRCSLSTDSRTVPREQETAEDQDAARSSSTSQHSLGVGPHRGTVSHAHSSSSRLPSQPGLIALANKMPHIEGEEEGARPCKRPRVSDGRSQLGDSFSAHGKQHDTGERDDMLQVIKIEDSESE